MSLVVAFLGLLGACGPEQRFALLGVCPVDGGAPIRDCRVGYRTFGTLAPDRGNAVLLLPWFQGTSADLGAHVGPGRLVDSRRHFVVAVDALGNGVSSSPSNSRGQNGARFPRFSMRDLVASQHALVTRTLRLERLEAVVGISMGGMQALAWATEYPGFARNVIAVAGSPRSTEDDCRRWEAAVAEVRSAGPWWRPLVSLRNLDPRSALSRLRTDPEDYAVQAAAIANLDLAVPFGGSLEDTAAAVQARTLIVVSARDEVVDPGPARELARLAGARLLVLDGRCGHQATRCDREVLFAAARDFLDGGR